MPDTPKMTPIPAGALFTVTEGEYSDYRIEGVFRATADIDADALLAEWLAAHPEQREPYEFKAGDFLAWVFRKGLFEPVASHEWYLGDYGHADRMAVRDADTWEVNDAL